MTTKDELRKLLIERSVRLGDFTLASGAKSDYYIDARRTTMSAEGQKLVGRVAYAAIQDHGLDPTHVGGLTMGADPIAYAIAHVSALEGWVIDGFSVRKRAKDHGTGQRIEGGLPKDGRALMPYASGSGDGDRHRRTPTKRFADMGQGGRQASRQQMERFPVQGSRRHGVRPT